METQSPEEVTYPIENIGQKNHVVQAIYILISITGITGNSIAISVIFSSKSIRRMPASTLLASQSLIDLVSCILVATMMLTGDLYTDQGLPKGWVGYLICWAWISDVLFYASITISTYNLLALSVERTISVVRPIMHRAKVNRSIVRRMAVAAWIWGLALNMAVMMPTTQVQNGRCVDWDVFPSPAHKRTHRMAVFTVMYALPSTCIVICYIMIWRSMKGRVEPSPSDTAVVGTSAGEPVAKLSREMKVLLKTMITVVFCFFVCFTPRFVIHVISAWTSKVQISGSEMQLATLLQFSNSAINPIVYTFQYKDYQHQLRRIFGYILPERFLPGASVTINSISINTTNTEVK